MALRRLPAHASHEDKERDAEHPTSKLGPIACSWTCRLWRNPWRRGGGPDGGTGNECTLTANTTATSTVNTAGCAILTRDTSSCQASRQAAGLSGMWLKFSCRVTLSMSGGQVTAKSDGQPDYKSKYFPSSNACYQKETSGVTNPNTIAVGSYTLNFPTAPNMTAGKMMGAVVGMALNGVTIFGNFAAPAMTSSKRR